MVEVEVSSLKERTDLEKRKGSLEIAERDSCTGFFLWCDINHDTKEEFSQHFCVGESEGMEMQSHFG